MTQEEFENFVAHIDSPEDVGCDLVDTFAGAFGDEPLMDVAHAALCSLMAAVVEHHLGLSTVPEIMLHNKLIRAVYNLGRLRDVPTTYHS